MHLHRTFLKRNEVTNMKRLVVNFLMSLSLASILVGVGSHSAKSQVFRCSDIRLGEDERQEVRGNNSRAESRVAVGQSCENANWHESWNESVRRGAEQNQEFWRRWNESSQQNQEASERALCSFYGIDSPRCTHEGLRWQNQQEQAVERQQQQEAARIQQESERENYYRRRVQEAQYRVQYFQEQIAFWSDRPEMRQRHEQMLPLAEADLQRAQQELQSYLNQK
jgi:hypothetical protein